MTEKRLHESQRNESCMSNMTKMLQLFVFEKGEKRGKQTHMAALTHTNHRESASPFLVLFSFCDCVCVYGLALLFSLCVLSLLNYPCFLSLPSVTKTKCSFLMVTQRRRRYCSVPHGDDGVSSFYVHPLLLSVSFPLWLTIFVCMSDASMSSLYVLKSPLRM